MPKRNPLARELRLNPLYRARRGKTRHQAEQRADRWSRAAKHKPPKGSPGSAHGPGDFFGRSYQILHRGLSAGGAGGTRTSGGLWRKRMRRVRCLRW
jgi:hypothetical protein